MGRRRHAARTRGGAGMSLSTLRVVRPLVVTPAMLIDTNVPEDDYPVWSAATTYAADARVILVSTHKIYQSVTASNINHNPADNDGNWQEVGPTRPWRVFDTSTSTQTQRPLGISYRIRPGVGVTAVAALNLVGAASIRIRVVDPVLGTLYDRTTGLAGQLIYPTWWDWHFGPRTEQRQSAVMDLPAAPSADVLIDLVGTAELAVGTLLIGQQRAFSMGVKLGARLGIQDYSRKERNDFGDLVLVERAYAKRASFSMPLRASEVDTVYDFLTDVRATPCLWVGSSRFEATTVYGIYKSFDIVLAYHDYSDCELELEGLT